MLINTYLDTEGFVHLYYPEDDTGPAGAQGCSAGARMASKYPSRPPSPEYSQVSGLSAEMSERERYRAPPPPEPPPHIVRAADLYPRLRTHYEEPGLQIGFTPICGEFVKWVGRFGDSGSLAMSNYRLHVQPKRRHGPGISIPLRLIDAVELPDLSHLVVLCKHGRQLRCTFPSGDQCAEWFRRLSGALTALDSVKDTFAAAYAAWAKEQPPTSIHRELLRASHAQQKNWFGPELERLGFTTRGAWRVSTANADYKLCLSYPPLLVVPASIGDEDLDSVARFRSMRRIPAVVWRDRESGAVLARSSQPEVGWLGWRSSEDERLLAAFVAACAADRPQEHHSAVKPVKLLIIDARSYATAVTNRARGGGCECQQYYPAADIQFMSLPNIHHVRKSFQQMRTLIADTSDQINWLGGVERTLWLQYVGGVLRAAHIAARTLRGGRPVLVHCSDGWDRTPQIVATAQLLLDPYYRTLQGFRVLIEREWLDFGHKFADRCGHQFGGEDSNEKSPIFLQWLDVVHQIMLQYPCSFEFNEAYLIKLGIHVHSCMFGTFLCNTVRERAEARIHDVTAHVWQLLLGPAYRNHLYEPKDSYVDQALWPEYGVRSMRVWWGLFGGQREQPEDERVDPRSAVQTHHAPNALMTKTRSCDNLLNETERRTTQRRCSDPNLAADVKKLPIVGCGEAGGALTDSCVDELPALPLVQDSTHDQFGGLNPDHFENPSRSSRDLASGSSSLDGEFNAAENITNNVLNYEETPNSVDGEEKIIGVIQSPVDCSVQDQDTVDNAAENIIEENMARISLAPEVETPENVTENTSDAYSDVPVVPEAVIPVRNQSVTNRTVSESSNHSFTNLDICDTPRTDSTDDSHESSPLDNISVNGKVSNNVINGSTNHNREDGLADVSLNGASNKFHRRDFNGVRRSSFSSEGSEGGRCRGGSELTLCPPPRCCFCTRPSSATSGIDMSGDSSASACWCGAGGRVRCVCGAEFAGPATDPLDGLPPVVDPLQARLHQIILNQKKVVEELSFQLRDAREALRQLSPSPATAHTPALSAPLVPRRSPSASEPAQMRGSSSSGSGSGSEVEVGEEAHGATVWLPDSAAPHCQYCGNVFWLGRRRHHCRRCGGIYCSSCSEMSSWGECGYVRVCRRCLNLR